MNGAQKRRMTIIADGSGEVNREKPAKVMPSRRSGKSTG
jgi:hypothetical protein